MMAISTVFMAWPLLILIIKTEPDFHVFTINEMSLNEEGFMKEIMFFLFVFSMAGLLMGMERGIEIVFGAPLTSLPVQESAALLIFGTGLNALAGYGRRKHQLVLVRQSREDRNC
jgi:hypothetical protein